LSVAAGVFAFMVPAMTALILLILIASWQCAAAFQIAAAIQLRKHITGEWLLALSAFCRCCSAMLLYNRSAERWQWFGSSEPTRCSLAFYFWFLHQAARLGQLAGNMVPPPSELAWGIES